MGTSSVPATGARGQIPVLIFHSSGNILPIREDNFMIPPIREQVELVYVHLGVERLLELARNFTGNNDLFMELHRRASARYFRGEGVYEWDIMPNQLDEGDEDAQLERARMIMAYDAKWCKDGKHPRNPNNPIPKRLGLEENVESDKSEDILTDVLVRVYQKQQLELHGVKVTPQLLGATRDDNEVWKMTRGYLSAWGLC